MIIEKARELGMALSESEEFIRMVNARKAIDEDSGASTFVANYQENQAALMGLLAGDDPDQDNIQLLSMKLAELQQELTKNVLFVELLEAQNAFQRLMRDVNVTIAECIGAEVLTDDRENGHEGYVH